MMVEQREMLLGPVGTVTGDGVACRGCGYVLPADAPFCAACGFERVPYPAGKVSRYDWVLDQPIDPTAKIVLIALVAHDKPSGNGIFPSLERLADLTSLSRRAVVNAIARLRASGWVTRERTRHRRGQQATNRYRIHQPGQAECRSRTQQSAGAALEGLTT